MHFHDYTILAGGMHSRCEHDHTTLSFEAIAVFADMLNRFGKEFTHHAD